MQTGRHRLHAAPACVPLWCSMSSSAFSLPTTLQLFGLMPAMTLAAVFDLRSRRIPNSLVASIAVAGVLVAAFLGGLHGVGRGCLSFGVATTACAPLYLLRGIAGGDVKLVLASAFWLTLAELLVALAATALCGALLGAGFLLLSRETTHLPYAASIASGTGFAVCFI